MEALLNWWKVVKGPKGIEVCFEALSAIVGLY